jgi:hypothetical protein
MVGVREREGERERERERGREREREMYFQALLWWNLEYSRSLAASSIIHPWLSGARTED